MEKVLENVKKEIKQIGEQGISANNIDVLYKLIDIEKDIYEICEKKEKMSYKDYGKKLESRKYHDGKSYKRSHMSKFDKYLDNLTEDIENYEYKIERYGDGAPDELERVMYSLCSIIEHIHDLSETPEEKTIIKHHMDKIEEME